LPFGVQCVPDSEWLYCGKSPLLLVSIAFRRSVRSRRGALKMRGPGSDECLHCLSAFSAFPTHATRSPVQSCPPGSPLPFGVQCVPDAFLSAIEADKKAVSIAFRRSVRSRLPAAVKRYGMEIVVSIAFRRSVRSRLYGSYRMRRWRNSSLHCLSAFSAFPTDPYR